MLLQHLALQMRTHDLYSKPECCLIAGAEKKGATVQRIMEKGIKIDGYYKYYYSGAALPFMQWQYSGMNRIG